MSQQISIPFNRYTDRKKYTPEGLQYNKILVEGLIKYLTALTQTIFLHSNIIDLEQKQRYDEIIHK